MRGELLETIKPPQTASCVIKTQSLDVVVSFSVISIRYCRHRKWEIVHIRKFRGKSRSNWGERPRPEPDWPSVWFLFGRLRVWPGRRFLGFPVRWRTWLRTTLRKRDRFFQVGWSDWCEGYGACSKCERVLRLIMFFKSCFCASLLSNFGSNFIPIGWGKLYFVIRNWGGIFYVYHNIYKMYNHTFPNVRFPHFL